LVSPAIWRGDALVCAPLLEDCPEFTADLTNNKNEFILSLLSD